VRRERRQPSRAELERITSNRSVPRRFKSADRGYPDIGKLPFLLVVSPVTVKLVRR
jgi:hypothetical protein